MKNLNVVIEFDKLMYVKNNIQKKKQKTLIIINLKYKC